MKAILDSVKFYVYVYFIIVTIKIKSGDRMRRFGMIAVKLHFFFYFCGSPCINCKVLFEGCVEVFADVLEELIEVEEFFIIGPELV